MEHPARLYTVCAGGYQAQPDGREQNGQQAWQNVFLSQYGCAVQIFLLLFQYALLMAMIQLTFTVFKSRRTGIIAALIVNFAGYVLTPDRFMTWLELPQEMQYYANLLSAWLSPLQHATYTMHNFSYDLLPRLGTSYLLLGGTALLLTALSLWRMRSFSFNFTGGYSDE